MNKPKNIKKKQHYVPEFYLRGFSFQADKMKKIPHVYCYDKKTGKVSSPSVEDIGSEKYFYDIEKIQDVENILSELEGEMSIAHKKLLNTKNLNKLAIEDKFQIAAMVATKLLRTRSFRNTVKKASEGVSRLGEEDGFKVLEFINDLKSEETAKKYQINLFAKSSLELIKSLFQMKWVLFINKTQIPYWCSDHPFSYFNPEPYDNFDGLGFERSGSQIHFPLSAKLSLAIVNPIYYILYPNMIVSEKIESIVFNNHLQVKDSYRFIFSPTKDFSS